VFAFILQPLYSNTTRIELQKVHFAEKIKISVVGSHQELPVSRAPKGIFVDVTGLKFEELDQTGIFVLRIENAATHHHDPVQSLVKGGFLTSAGLPRRHAVKRRHHPAVH